MAKARLEDLPPEWLEYWNERAAIRQFDAGYPKKQAEYLALEDTIFQMELDSKGNTG